MSIRSWFLVLILPVLTACVTVGGEPPTQNEKASKINVELGMGYLAQGNYEQSNQKLLKAIRQNPDSASAHWGYAYLQDILMEKEVAAKHYKKATELDPKDSRAANNYGNFLCRNGREKESEKYFINALKDPLYGTPEFAYTNAARCLLRINETAKAKQYLTRALAAKSDFGNALIEMAILEFDEGKHENAKLYIDRFHLTAKPTARSLWLAIRNELEISETSNVDELGQQLESDFPRSTELKSWLELQ
ncbi:MAG: type IV pilus assembly protein PilF [Gammaproteobacteria bacterium]|jgi:type IV pilus assembly protein PilF